MVKGGLLRLQSSAVRQVESGKQTEESADWQDISNSRTSNRQAAKAGPVLRQTTCKSGTEARLCL